MRCRDADVLTDQPQPLPPDEPPPEDELPPGEELEPLDELPDELLPAVP
jgi:hypothetical protein